MSDRSYNAFKMAQHQFDNIAEYISLDSGTRELLRVPMREYHINMPIRMDDGSVRVFKGFRCQHNDALGPGKGGIRFHPLETIDTIRALSMWMTWKCSVVDIPLGGSEGGVVCDPHHLSLREQENICRAWVRQLSRDMGPVRDVPAPDVMTNGQHMLWMLDEYETITGAKYPGMITGKPVGMGGSLGRTEATGFGVVFAIREALKELGIAPESTTASIQGFGNVAQHAVQLYNQLGGTVICVSCWDQTESKSFTFRKKSGIDLEELQNITDRFGGIDRTKAEALGYEVLDGGKWISEEVDILIPAALENQITGESVNKISSSVKIIAEAANGPTTPDADENLKSRGIYLIPDFLANAGGVTCSYFEQVQNNMNYYWEKDEVIGKLDIKMTSAFMAVSELARKNKLYMRDAAYIISVSRVAEACKKRGWV